MRFHFFTIPALDPGAAAEELNLFLGAHRVSTVQRELVQDGASSYWSVCVTSVDGEVAAAPSQSRRARVDYREILEADEFGLYDRLRTLRKQQADAEGLPPFAVFTNEQLAEMVRRRVTTRAALAAIDGIGDARLERYAPAFLEVLEQGVPRLSAAAADAAQATPDAPAED